MSSHFGSMPETDCAKQYAPAASGRAWRRCVRRSRRRRRRRRWCRGVAGSGTACFLNGGRNLASASSVVSARGDSSRLMTMGSCFFCGTSTGTICDSMSQRSCSDAFADDSRRRTGPAPGGRFCIFRRPVRRRRPCGNFRTLPNENHRIDNLGIADAVAVARAGKQIRTIGHRLVPARDDVFVFTEHDALRGERDRFSAPTTDFIDGERGDAWMQSAADAAWRAGFWPMPAWTTS